LLIVDNASREPLAPRLDLAWHPHSRVLREEKLGLTPARQCAISAAVADLLVFVDDDNILAPDYLVQARQIAESWPQIGVWGCGRFQPVWEKAPQPQHAPLIAYLAVHETPRDIWSDRPFDYSSIPAGAGMCLRAIVALEYARRVRDDPRRSALGRTGASLAACEDFDIAQTSIQLGLGTGIFRSLALQHLMPATRVEEKYLIRLVEGHAFSTVVLMALYGRQAVTAGRSLLARIREYRLRRSLSPIDRLIHDARRRGEARAFAHLTASAASEANSA
jgi:glycosyltransferase involved in cell wall biosynthesis